MNKKYIPLAVAFLIITAAAFKVTIANEAQAITEEPASKASSSEEVKSLAYYVAHTQEALKKNRECYEKGLDMQEDLNCAYSLHALQISYVGGDKSSGYKFNRN